MNKKYNKRAFTLVELIVTIGIIVILTAIVAAKYSGLSEQASLNKSKANMSEIRTALMNHYFMSKFNDTEELPAMSADSLMNDTWGETTILYNGRSAKTIFSSGKVPRNPKGNFYHYWTVPTDHPDYPGIGLSDPDYGLVIKYSF
jgi:prepilin-type N-terminal cleavage/methylation domain-containing protein